MSILRDSPEAARGETPRETVRIEEVRALTERTAALLGVGGAAVRVGSDLKTGARLTSNGIELMVNHCVSENAVQRGLPESSRAGAEPPDSALAQRLPYVKGRISLEEFDRVTACIIALRAHDFLDPAYGPSPFSSRALTKASQRYLVGTVDDLAAELKARKLPYIAKRHAAYLSRSEQHFMQALPLQQQFMKTLRLYLMEPDPRLMALPPVVQALGTTGAMSPLVEQVRAVLEDEALDYRQRQAAACALLEAPFTAMATADAANLPYYEALHMFDDEESYAPSQSAANDEQGEQEEFEAAFRAEKKLETVTEKNLDQLIADTGEVALPDDSSPSLHLPSATEEAKSLSFAKKMAEEYELAIEEGKRVIDELADLFMRIAQPRESLSVPRYDPRCFARGTRLNPRALADAHMQLETDTNRSVWQRVRRKKRFQRKTFNGLDVLLAIDVSFSMQGERARFAALTAAYAVEGLQLAYERCIAAADGGTVDIRTQLLAFGEGWAPLTPLATVQSEDDKRFAFRAIDLPSSNQTMVGGVLRRMERHAREHPDREVLCLVVSDGLFADNLHARKTALGMPANVYLGHVNIGRFGGVPLTEHYESVSDPAKLPEKIQAVLRTRLDS